LLDFRRKKDWRRNEKSSYLRARKLEKYARDAKLDEVSSVDYNLSFVNQQFSRA